MFCLKFLTKIASNTERTRMVYSARGVANGSLGKETLCIRNILRIVHERFPNDMNQKDSNIHTIILTISNISIKQPPRIQ